jgi:hypothetical protein
MERRKEAGQALIFGVVALGLLLMGFAGLGIDIGYLRYEKRLQQTATDSAALAGAAEIPYAASGNPIAAGKHATTLNGFTDGVNGTTVRINHPPLSGPHNGDADYVEAYVAKVHPTFFMKVLGITTQTVTARAVAVWGNGSNNSCVYTLGNPGTGIQGISVSGTPTLNAPTCGIVDNGNFCTNGNRLNVTAGAIGVAGSAGGAGNSCSGGTVTPTPIAGIAPAGDPLEFLPAPSTGVSNGALNITSAATVSPGTYTSISISGASGDVTFSPGTYIVTNGISITGNQNVSGDGVTFYVAGGGVDIHGGGNVTLTAPTTGTYAGILFYQSPSDTTAAVINGNSSSFFEGALYFPKASLDFSGTAGSTSFNTGSDYTLIVSSALTVNGTATINLNSNFSSLPGGSPLQTTILVE